MRYFGWMHPSATRRRMRIETLLEKKVVVTAAPPPTPAWHLQCPHCARVVAVTARCPGARAGHHSASLRATVVTISALPRSVTLVRVGTLPRAARGPPPTCRR